MPKTDAKLAQADADGTVDGKALAIKLAAMAGATVLGIIGTVLVQKAITSDDKDPE